LRVSIEDLAHGSGSTPEQMARAVKLVQSFEPPGIAARDLRECLLLQLERQGKKDTLAYKVVDKYLEDLGRNRIPQVAKALRTTPAALYEVLTQIKQLQPRPGNAAEDGEIQYVLPELTVEEDDES